LHNIWNCFNIFLIRHARSRGAIISKKINQKKNQTRNECEKVLKIIFLKKVAFRSNICAKTQIGKFWALHASLNEDCQWKNVVSLFANRRRYERELQMEKGKINGVSTKRAVFAEPPDISDQSILESTKIYRRAVALPRAAARIKASKLLSLPLIPSKPRVNTCTSFSSVYPFVENTRIFRRNLEKFSWFNAQRYVASEIHKNYLRKIRENSQV